MIGRLVAFHLLLLGCAMPAAALGPVVDFSRTAVDFGYQPLPPVVPPHRDAQRVLLTNVGTDVLEIRTIAIGGLNADNFSLGNGSCVVGTALLPGQRCTFEIIARATAGLGRGQLEMTTEDSPISPALVQLTVHGLTVDGTYHYPRFAPRTTEFDEQRASTPGPIRPIVLTNVGTGNFGIDGFRVVGRNPNDFDVTTDCGPGVTIAVGQSCTFNVQFLPGNAGRKYAEINVNISDGNLPTPGTFAIPVFGTSDTGEHPEGTVRVVEFYNPALDHYFISSLAPDIQALDTQKFPGWERTGSAFYAYPKTFAFLSPVCRFYLPPPYGDSHFYSASPDECALTRTRFPQFSYESPDVMFIALPDLATGRCTSNVLPVYRLFNNRADGNHRYVSDLALRDAFVAKGYVAEGYGPDSVIMCAAP